jgi:hypothetical protein
VGALDEQLALHRRHRPDHRVVEPAGRSLGVDAEAEDAQGDATVVEVGEQGAEVAGVAPEARQLGDDEGVAGPQVVQEGVKLRAGGAALAGRGLAVDAVAPVDA